jgi:hypothetical protein
VGSNAKCTYSPLGCSWEKRPTGRHMHRWEYNIKTDGYKLRRIYGPPHEKGWRHPRWSSEIYRVYKYLNIVSDIKIRGLGRTGQIAGVEGERIPGKLLNRKFHITRWVRKSRTRWDALQILGVGGWRRRVEKREEWKWRLPRRWSRMTRVWCHRQRGDCGLLWTQW